MLDTVRTLFPGADVQFGRPSTGADFDFRFVPNARRPNLVVPATPARAAASAVRRFSAAADLRDSGNRWAAGLALRMGTARLARDAIAVRGSSDSILRHLHELFGQPVTASIAIGTARANRKPVLEVFDCSGRTVAFVKVGVDPVSCKDVEAEARNLKALASRAPTGLSIPELIDHSWWGDRLVLAMTPLATRCQRPGARRRVPTSLMGAFSRAWDTERLPLAQTPFWHRLQQSAGSLSPSEPTERLRIAMARVEQRWGSTYVETGAWHGDWTPWNMAWRAGLLQLWDFERLDCDGLFGLDVFHYVVNETMQRAGVGQAQLDTAISAGEELLECKHPQSRAVAVAYLAAIAVRYQLSAAGLRGELIADRALFMVNSLERIADSR